MYYRTIILLVFTVLSGCASYWSGTLSANVAIPPEKYNVVRTVSGEAKTFIFLGIVGGLGHTNLVQEAKENLLHRHSHSLSTNYLLANWSVCMERNIFLLGLTQKCIVTADLISLDGNPGPFEVKPNVLPVDTEIRPYLDSLEFPYNGSLKRGLIIKALKKKYWVVLRSDDGKESKKEVPVTGSKVLPRVR